MIYSIRVHFTLCRHFYSMLMYRFTEAVFTFKAHAHKAKLEIIKKNLILPLNQIKDNILKTSFSELSEKLHCSYTL